MKNRPSGKMSFRVPEQLLLPWDSNKTISSSHAAEILQRSLSTVYRLIQEGSLSAFQYREATSAFQINYDSVMVYINSLHQKHGLKTRY